MVGTITEFFGYRVEDSSPAAIEAAHAFHCPFLGSTCEKTINRDNVRVPSGVCSIKPMTSKAVICCPIRLYADDYRILHDVAEIAFESQYALVPGGSAVSEAHKRGEKVVGVFGKKWGGELRVPKKDGLGGYWVDWILALVDPSGELIEFTAVEVQSIDTTGNYQDGREALLADLRKVMKTTAGFNWENVNKRILPQLVYKGQLLQRERLCKKGLFFVCPEQVYGEIVKRLGGVEKLPEFELQPPAITFMTYGHDDAAPVVDGKIIPLRNDSRRTTTVYKLQEAFNNVQLTVENVYRDAIRAGLGI